MRQRAYEQLVDRYDAIVFVDADDVLDATRVAAARDALASCDVSGCALQLADDSGRDIGLSFGAPGHGSVAELLPRYNVFGLSNSAYRSALLARCLPLPSTCELIDWLLASRACALDARFGFEHAPRMLYRRHDTNCAPALPPFTPRQVLTASAHVVRHYALLLDGNWTWRNGRRRPFEVARARAEVFHAAITASPDLLYRYVQALNDLPPRLVWWWAVAHPDLEDVWNTSR